MSGVTPDELVVGVGGGIGAYKAAFLVSTLVQKGLAVSVVMTEAAQKFVGSATFHALTGRRVHTGLFDGHTELGQPHVTLVQDAKLLVIAPATADIIAKAAHGLADDLLSTMLLVARCPVLFAPAMNDQMWSHPAVQENVETLKQRGAHIVGPGKGWLSCRTEGIGRMSEVDELLAEIIDRVAE